MALYQFADYIVELDNRYPYLEKHCADYAYHGEEEAQVRICVSPEEIERERERSQRDFEDGYLESVCTYRKLCLQLPAMDAVLLHASVIDCAGRGIGFFAHSGVGKTTHTRLWRQMYRPELVIVNGDKPIVRFFDGIPYAYGTPWAGKEGFQQNCRVRLQELCLIERAPENKVEPLSQEEAVHMLMHQVLRPSDPMGAMKTFDLMEQLVKSCRFWRIRCTATRQAAVVAHDTIFGQTE